MENVRSMENRKIIEEILHDSISSLDNKFTQYLYASLMALGLNLFSVYLTMGFGQHVSFFSLLIAILPLYFTIPPAFLLLRLDSLRRETAEQYINMRIGKSSIEDGLKQALLINTIISRYSRMLLIYILAGAAVVIFSSLVFQNLYW